MVTQTGCDAVMIGRTAPANPWIFRQIEQYCAGFRDAHVGTAALGCSVERSSTDLDSSGQLDVQGSGLRPDGQPRAAVPTWAVAEFRRQEKGLPDAVGKMKQFASWFTHGVPGGAALRKEIYESKSAPEILARVEDFFESRLCGAGAPSTSSGQALVREG